MAHPEYCFSIEVPVYGEIEEAKLQIIEEHRQIEAWKEQLQDFREWRNAAQARRLFLVEELARADHDLDVLRDGINFRLHQLDLAVERQVAQEQYATMLQEANNGAETDTFIIEQLPDLEPVPDVRAVPMYNLRLRRRVNYRQ